MAQELTFNITEDKRQLKAPTQVKDFNLTFGDSGDITNGKRNWVQGRVGDSSLRRVFINLVEGTDNTPTDITGMMLRFCGVIYDSSNQPHVVVSQRQSTIVDAQGGRFRFDFPKQAFTVAGAYKQAFFQLIKQGSGDVVATLEFDLTVLANFVFADLVPEDYIDAFDEIADKLVASLESHTTEADKTLTEYQNKVNDLISSLNQSSNTTTTMLQTIQTKIEGFEQKLTQDGLFTKAEADTFQSTLEQTVESKIAENKPHIYDTVAAMQADATLKDGETAQTLGYYELNDGGGDFYKIATAEPTSGYSVKLTNSLYACQIYTDDSNFYSDDEIKVEKKRYYDTDVYVATIKKTDKQGNLIMPYVTQNAIVDNVVPDNGKNLTPTAYARYEHTNLTINATLSVVTTDGEGKTKYRDANVIGNGKVIHRWNFDGKPIPASFANFVYLGIKADRTPKEYPNTTTPEEMIADGVQQAFLTYWRMIKDGNVVDTSTFTGNEGTSIVTAPHPSHGIGWKDDGTMVIISTDGRTTTQIGLTNDQFTQVFLKEGVTNAWHLDGGGSTSLTFKGEKMNRNIDSNGRSDRNIGFTLNFKKPSVGGGVASVYSQIGQLKQDLRDEFNTQLMPYEAMAVNGLGMAVVNSDEELDNWLNSKLVDQFNSWQRGNGYITTGFLRTNYQNSAPGKAANRSQTMVWSFVYKSSPSKDWGSIQLTDVAAPEVTVYRKYSRNGTPDKWTDWICPNFAHAFTPTNIDSRVMADKRYFNKTLAMTEISIIFQGKTANGTWETIMGGLPIPIRSNQSIFRGSQGGHCGVDVDGNGNLIVNTRDTAINDSYEINFMYLNRTLE